MKDLFKFRKSTLFILYILGLIFAFSSAIPAYVNSSFLSGITNERIVGVIYAIASVITLISLVLIPKMLKKYGNYKVTLTLVVALLFDFLGLAFFKNIDLVLFCFVINGALSSIIYFNFDVFVEHNSEDIKTGGIRGIYLTCINFAWLLSPCLAGIIVGESSYKRIYLVVALLMIPIILIISSNLKNFKDPEYKTFNVIATIKSVKSDKNIKNIIFSEFLLQLFYSWMIVYTPIYLNQYIGFSWQTIGLIFSVMLLPFVLIEIPMGFLADKKIGEKEILTVGFLIMGISTAIIPLVNNHSVIVWAIILFMTRVGAAMVEVMSDTYFFKNISDKNLNIINLYRTMTPLSYVVAAIVTTILIFFIPLGSIFYLLGLLMIFGLNFSLAIKDTK
jgi:MFS family permease